MNASEAKKAGRQLMLRKDWEAVKVGVMRELVFAKFNQNTALAEKLRATGDASLEEGNDWGDRTWGKLSMASVQTYSGRYSWKYVPAFSKVRRR